MIPRVLRAYPTLFRVGLMDMVAYRAEFLIWVLTTNMPLVMLGVWHAAAAEAPVGRWGQAEFVAYFLSTLFVRLLAQSWVMWELTMDVRNGTLAQKLLRPIHPILAYSAEQVAAVPMRCVFSIPVLAALIWTSHAMLPFHDPSRAAIWLASMVGAWLITFLAGILMGSASFFLDSAFSLFDVWMALNTLLSGYLLPLELFPPWVQSITNVLPFRFMLGFPVEVLMGATQGDAALQTLGAQWLWVAGLLVAVRLAWRAGERRFQAFGG